MKPYKRWSEEQRKKSYVETLKAVEDGVIPKRSECSCNICGQSEGIIDFHNWDYDHPYKFVEPLCFRCHLMYHSLYRDYDAVMRYFSYIKSGMGFTPIYTRDLNVLAEENQVGLRRRVLDAEELYRLDQLMEECRKDRGNEKYPFIDM